ncbi:MAG: GIY-YIG nuclease family protein [Oscillospiraceae bacterium]|nr:GIY-YIG nuclease family protein [Oscillospiraceae bacterium]
MHYAYLARCADGTLYAGWTCDLRRRMAAHNAGRGAKYTRSRRPVALCYYEAFETKPEALRREAAFKRMTRAEKLALCAGFSGMGETG